MENKEFLIPENAIIEKIEDDNFFLESEIENKYRRSYCGLRITTNKGLIQLLIENENQCREYWEGLYFDTPDDKNQFIGAKILKVKEINISLDNILGKDEERYETQVRIETDKGDLQYAVYNAHNGYYDHTTILQVFDKIEKDYL